MNRRQLLPVALAMGGGAWRRVVPGQSTPVATPAAPGWDGVMSGPVEEIEQAVFVAYLNDQPEERGRKSFIAMWGFGLRLASALHIDALVEGTHRAFPEIMVRGDARRGLESAYTLGGGVALPVLGDLDGARAWQGWYGTPSHQPQGDESNLIVVTRWKDNTIQMLGGISDGVAEVADLAVYAQMAPPPWSNLWWTMPEGESLPFWIVEARDITDRVNPNANGPLDEPISRMESDGQEPYVQTLVLDGEISVAEALYEQAGSTTMRLVAYEMDAEASAIDGFNRWIAADDLLIAQNASYADIEILPLPDIDGARASVRVTSFGTRLLVAVQRGVFVTHGMAESESLRDLGDRVVAVLEPEFTGDGPILPEGEDLPGKWHLTEGPVPVVR